MPHAVLADYGLEAISTIEALTVSDDLPSLEEREQELIDQGVSEEDLGPDHHYRPGPDHPLDPAAQRLASGTRRTGSRRTT